MMDSTAPPLPPLSTQYLLPGSLLAGLGFHLLHLQAVYPPPAHEQVMVPYAQLQDLNKCRLQTEYKTVKNEASS